MSTSSIAFRSLVSLSLLFLVFDAPRAGETSGFAKCLSTDRTSNSLTTFIINSCKQKLMVRWTDEGGCKTYCALDVGAGSRASAGAMTGTVWMGACEWPTLPKSTDGMVTYSCGNTKMSGKSTSSGSTAPSTGNSSSGQAPSGNQPQQSPGAQPSRPAKLGQCPPLDDYYPPRSLRAGEQGRAVVSVTITADGAPVAAAIAESSGSPRLDEAAVKFARACRYDPGVPASGQPGTQTLRLPVRFRLEQ